MIKVSFRNFRSKKMTGFITMNEFSKHYLTGSAGGEIMPR